jgi:hypothetical protein
MSYKLIQGPFANEPHHVQRLVDGAFIPFAPDNTDYQQYLKWVAEGNSPLPADVEASPSTPLPADEGAA